MLNSILKLPKHCQVEKKKQKNYPGNTLQTSFIPLLELLSENGLMQSWMLETLKLQRKGKSWLNLTHRLKLFLKQAQLSVVSTCHSECTFWMQFFNHSLCYSNQWYKCSSYEEKCQKKKNQRASQKGLREFKKKWSIGTSKTGKVWWIGTIIQKSGQKS